MVVINQNQMQAGSLCLMTVALYMMTGINIDTTISQKTTMRRFMSLREQGALPSSVTLKDVTEWLSGEECFISK